VFVTTGYVTAHVAGPGVILAYIAAGVSALLSSFCYSEVGRAGGRPRAGGEPAASRLLRRKGCSSANSPHPHPPTHTPLHLRPPPHPPQFAVDIPCAGGAYTYIAAALGEFLAWITVANLIFEYILANAAAVRGFSPYVSLGRCARRRAGAGAGQQRLQAAGRKRRAQRPTSRRTC
jgi:hypothetical protein